MIIYREKLYEYYSENQKMKSFGLFIFRILFLEIVNSKKREKNTIITELIERFCCAHSMYLRESILCLSKIINSLKINHLKELINYMFSLFLFFLVFLIVLVGLY